MRPTAQHVRDYLSAIPGYLDQLGLFIRPGSRPPDPDARHTKSPESGRPPIDLAVHDLARGRQAGWLDWRPGDDHGQRPDQSGWRHGILGTLWLWTFVAESEMDDLGHPAAPCEGQDAESICGWLAKNVDFMIDNHVDQADFATDVKLMHDALMRACGVKPDPVYYCPQCAWVIESQDGGSWWRCTGCRRTWTYASEIDRLLAAQADVVPLKQAALEVGRPLRTVQRWKARGWILPVARRGGVDQYSLAAVKGVAESTS